MVGYVVSEAWAAAHRDALERFWRAAAAAKEVLATDDAEWTRIAPLTGARDAAELARLRDAYRAGIPRRWGEAERAEAARLYRLLAEIGGPALVGEGRALAPGTFLDWVRY
jgi:NitT/TauT family transport system substrate-binding protein